MRAARLSAMFAALALRAREDEHVVRLSEMIAGAPSRLTGHGARHILVDDLDLLPGPKPPESVVIGMALDRQMLAKIRAATEEDPAPDIRPWVKDILGDTPRNRAARRQARFRR